MNLEVNKRYIVDNLLIEADYISLSDIYKENDITTEEEN